MGRQRKYFLILRSACKPYPKKMEDKGCVHSSVGEGTGADQKTCSHC